MPEESKLSWSRASFFAVSMTALGHAIQIHDGELGPSPYPTIAWLTVAILLAILGNFVLRATIDRRAFQFIVTLCLLANFAQLALKPPDHYLGEHRFSPLTPFTVQLLIVGVLCGRVLAGEGRARIVSFAAVLLVFAFLGGWIINNSPKPRIDVYFFQADAAAALADGRDPYANTSANIYGPNDHFYGEGFLKDGRVQVGYPYTPETLIAIMPATLMQFDLRYSHLAAILLSAILIAVASPGLLGFSAAMLFLTTPRIFLVLELSWTEPFTLLMLAGSVTCALRWPRLLPLALGLFFASKQYVPVAAALLFVGSRPVRETVVLLIKAIVVAVIVTLPIALWNIPAFCHSAILMQFRQPFRADSLSYLAWVGEAFWSKSALVFVPFAMLAAAVGLVLWRRRSIGFAAAVAFCLLLFFAFSKQAFANYYFFIIGAMGCAIAELASESAAPLS